MASFWSHIWGKIEGDRSLWVIAILLALFSLMPVYSASSNISFLYGTRSTGSMLLSHGGFLLLGILIIYGTHRMNYRHFGALSLVLLPVSVILLVYTLVQGHSVANASRWIVIPFVERTFQPSALAGIVLMLYLARGLTKLKPEKLKRFKSSFLPLLGPVFLICGLILPANFSTAALIFGASMILLFAGGYPLRHLGLISATGVAVLGLFLLLVMAFPGMSNRVDTWQSRVESFWSGESEENYQVTKAKMAIAEGNLLGKGPGKSIQKNFLPQSNSDFIYAVIVEEFGAIGGVLVVFFYVLLLIRTLIIATRAPSRFGSLAAMGAGLIIITQAMVNLGVAVNILPVTGQTLPLISAGGTSVWMTCFALGVILSISRGLPAKKDQPAEVNNLENTQYAVT